MSTGLQKQDLVRQLLQRSVTGAPVQIPFARDIMLASMHVAGTAYYEAAAVAGGAAKRPAPDAAAGARQRP